MYYREKSYQVEVYSYYSSDNTRFQAKYIEIILFISEATLTI